MRNHYKRLLFIYFICLLATGAQGKVLEFVENKGQWQGNFLYQAAAGNEAMYLHNNGFTFVLGSAANVTHSSHPSPQSKEDAIQKYHAYHVTFLNSNAGCKPVPTKIQDHYYNYFLGSDSTKWKSGIHPTLTVDYPSLYAGIDMHVSSENDRLKYEFILEPGADASTIVMNYEGQDKLFVKDGKLVVVTSVGEMTEAAPYTYQLVSGERKSVACKYKVEGNKVSFTFPKGYNKAEKLVIDPTLVFATFSGASMDNWGFTATYDQQGNVYVGGLASNSFGGSFPVTAGAFQTTYTGGNTTAGSQYPCDMVIFKYNASGSTMVYATFIGGASNEQPHSLIVNNNNELIIAGRTYSTNFPVTAGSYDNTANGGADMVVIKLNATGSALLASTYVGGSGDDAVNFDAIEQVGGNLKHNYGDDARSEVIYDALGNIYVTACTKSTNFPTANAIQSTLSGAQDAVVFKLNSTLSALTWSTYMGGTNDDAGYVLALDAAQTHLYVSGGTQSANFPSTPGTYQPSFMGGGTDGYIARFLNSGTYPLQRVTFIGTAGYDQCYGVQVDNDNGVYAMGQTLGGTFPVSTGVYSNPGSSQFVIKLDSNLTTNIFSTVYGSGNSAATNISPVAFLVDTCKNIYISGWGGQISGITLPGTGTTTGMPVLNSGTNSFYQSTTDSKDFYFIVFAKNALSLLYATFMGGTGPVTEHVDGGTSRFDKNGVVYQAICGGCGGSSSFPTTIGSNSTTNNSQNCNIIAVKLAFNLGSVAAGANANPNARGCPPFTVNFTNSSTNATAYDWNFADGTPGSTSPTPSHTFTIPGVYSVRMIAINPNACKERDTAYLTITVDSNNIHSGFTGKVTDSCNPYKIAFTNTSVYGSTPGSQLYTQFTWRFGDGTTFTGANPGSHSYPAQGTYTVTLIMRDTLSCNVVDSIKKTFVITSINLKAIITVPDSVCLGTPMQFTASGANATTTLWTFGDGQSSSSTAISHTYAAAGTYTVKFKLTNPKSCNLADSLTKTIKVNPIPVAKFDYAPIIPVTNTPINFTNTSVNADSYRWSFGDGGTSTDVNPSHLYKTSGTFKVCLLAKTAGGCTDSACKTVQADVRVLADLPTGFSPNADGQNDVLYVRGAAIVTMHLKIYNRWGQLVFESTSLADGWDGTYGGKPQPMEAYGYILDVTFLDDSSLHKTGNVTLVR